MAPYRHSLDGHVYDLSVASAQAEPIVITPSLMRAALSVQQHLAREEGRPYDAEILAEVEAEEATRNAFLASNWSWLFPKLKHPKVIEIKLDQSE